MLSKIPQFSPTFHRNKAATPLLSVCWWKIYSDLIFSRWLSRPYTIPVISLWWCKQNFGKASNRVSPINRVTSSVVYWRFHPRQSSSWRHITHELRACTTYDAVRIGRTRQNKQRACVFVIRWHRLRVAWLLYPGIVQPKA